MCVCLCELLYETCEKCSYEDHSVDNWSHNSFSSIPTDSHGVVLLQLLNEICIYLQFKKEKQKKTQNLHRYTDTHAYGMKVEM